MAKKRFYEEEREAEPRQESPAPPAAPSHAAGCSCHKGDTGHACCGNAVAQEWHIDPLCPWRP